MDSRFKPQACDSKSCPFQDTKTHAGLPCGAPSVSCWPERLEKHRGHGLLIFSALQMDDEDSILPRKLQVALEHVLDQRNELASDQDEGPPDCKRGKCSAAS